MDDFVQHCPSARTHIIILIDLNQKAIAGERITNKLPSLSSRHRNLGYIEPKGKS